MKHFTLIMLALCLAACSPQKRLNRLLRNHPELIQTDTVFTTVTIPPDTITVTETITLTADTTRLRAITDSLFLLVGQHPDTGVKVQQSAREVVYKYLTRVVPGSVSLPTDTMYVSDDDASVEIWFEGMELKGRFIRKRMDMDVPTHVHNIRPVHKVPVWLIVTLMAASFYVGGRFFRFGRR